MGSKRKFGDLGKAERELAAMRRYLGLNDIDPIIPAQPVAPKLRVIRMGWQFDMSITKVGVLRGTPEPFQVYVGTIDKDLAWRSAIAAVPKTHEFHAMLDCVWIHEIKEWYPTE